MLLVVITLALIAVAVGFFIYGAIGLSKYAFRLGTGPGLLCLLFPPYTFYFAFFKLEEEGKDFPTAAWLFGILTTALLVGVFWAPLSKVVVGDFESLGAGGAGSAVKEYQSKETSKSSDSKSEDDESSDSPSDEEQESAEETAEAEDDEEAGAAESSEAAGDEGEAVQGEGNGEEEEGSESADKGS